MTSFINDSLQIAINFDLSRKHKDNRKMSDINLKSKNPEEDEEPESHMIASTSGMPSIPDDKPNMDASTSTPRKRPCSHEFNESADSLSLPGSLNLPNRILTLFDSIENGQICLKDISKNKSDIAKLQKDVAAANEVLVGALTKLTKMSKMLTEFVPEDQDEASVPEKTAVKKKKKFESVELYKKSLSKVLLKDDTSRNQVFDNFLMSCSTWQMMRYCRGKSDFSCSASKYEFTRFNLYLQYGLLTKSNPAWVRHSRRKLHDVPGVDRYVSIVQFDFGGPFPIFAAVLINSQLMEHVFNHNLGCVLIKGEDKGPTDAKLQDQERVQQTLELRKEDTPDQTLEADVAASSQAPTQSNVDEFKKFLNDIIN